LSVTFFPAGIHHRVLLLGYRHISAEEWCTEQHCWFALQYVFGILGSTEKRQILRLVVVMLTFCSEIMKKFAH